MAELKVETYAVGPVSASACAPADMEGEAVARAVNAQHPTGVSQWAIADEPFASGATNPCPCNESPLERRHWLLHC